MTEYTKGFLSGIGVATGCVIFAAIVSSYII